MNPRHVLKRYLAKRDTKPRVKPSSWLGRRMHDAEIWHLGRRSVAGGVSLGFFLAFIPLPIQMLIAAPLALVLRVNLPVTMVAVWITNPVTAAPLYLFAYQLGKWILGEDLDAESASFEATFEGIAAVMGDIWQPLLVGCLVCGLVTAAIGNITVRWIWRYYLLRYRAKRRASREHLASDSE